MSNHLLDTYPSGSTIYALFDSFNSLGASVTLTGLAVTDIEIYKNGSVTQRSSDNGYALLDTDGIDFDGLTGIHGVSIDLSDNTDSGFYAVGSQYTVIISSVTIDSQTVSFKLGSFRIVAAEATTGYPAVTIKVGTGTGEINLSAGGVPVSSIAADAITAAATASDFGTEIGTAVWASATRILTAGTNIALAKGTGVTGFTDLSAADVRTAVGLGSANLDTQLAALATLIGDVPTNAELATALGALSIPTAAQNAAGLLDLAAGVETGLTVRQHFRLASAVLYGKSSGLETATAVYRNIGDSVDRISATVDTDGNRSAVTRNAT